MALNGKNENENMKRKIARDFLSPLISHFCHLLCNASFEKNYNEFNYMQRRGIWPNIPRNYMLIS